MIYYLLAEGPNVSREIFFFLSFEFFIAFNTPRPPLSVHKKVQSNRSSCLAGYGQHIYIYTNVLFYYIDR